MRPISFNRAMISMIENTSTGTWPAWPVNPDEPMKAITRRPLEKQFPVKSGEWIEECKAWRFEPQTRKASKSPESLGLARRSPMDP